MQWAIKRLLYLADDPVRYRRDIAVMWRHIQSVRPVVMPDRVDAVERLLAATADAGDEEGCILDGLGHHRVSPGTASCRYWTESDGLELRRHPGTGVPRVNGRGR